MVCLVKYAWHASYKVTIYDELILIQGVLLCPVTNIWCRSCHDDLNAKNKLMPLRLNLIEYMRQVNQTKT